MGRSNGPLVIFFTLVAFIVTVIFKADVDAQAGAYATGVLVLMTSAALAVSLNQFRLRKQSAWTYSLITVVFVYSVSDASEFIGDCLEVRGVEINGFKTLRCNSPAIPNAIAAILMHLRAETNTIPHTLAGQRGIHWPMCSSTSSSAKVKQHLLPVRFYVSWNATRRDAPAFMWARPILTSYTRLVAVHWRCKGF